MTLLLLLFLGQTYTENHIYNRSFIVAQNALRANVIVGLGLVNQTTFSTQYILNRCFIPAQNALRMSVPAPVPSAYRADSLYSSGLYRYGNTFLRNDNDTFGILRGDSVFLTKAYIKRLGSAADSVDTAWVYRLYAVYATLDSLRSLLQRCSTMISDSTLTDVIRSKSAGSITLGDTSKFLGGTVIKPNGILVGAGDSLIILDATMADSNRFYDTGDTMKIISDNPIAFTNAIDCRNYICTANNLGIIGWNAARTTNTTLMRIGLTNNSEYYSFSDKQITFRYGIGVYFFPVISTGDTIYKIIDTTQRVTVLNGQRVILDSLYNGALTKWMSTTDTTKITEQSITTDTLKSSVGTTSLKIYQDGSSGYVVSSNALYLFGNSVADYIMLNAKRDSASAGVTTIRDSIKARLGLIAPLVSVRNTPTLGTIVVDTLGPDSAFVYTQDGWKAFVPAAAAGGMSASAMQDSLAIVMGSKIVTAGDSLNIVWGKNDTIYTVVGASSGYAAPNVLFGGQRNYLALAQASDSIGRSVILGGFRNYMDVSSSPNYYILNSFIIGGKSNWNLAGWSSGIVGGDSNRITTSPHTSLVDSNSVIVGGKFNVMNANNSVIAGGTNNQIEEYAGVSSRVFIGGGRFNVSDIGAGNGILAPDSCRIDVGNYNLVGGRRSKVTGTAVSNYSQYNLLWNSKIGNGDYNALVNFKMADGTDSTLAVTKQIWVCKDTIAMSDTTIITATSVKTDTFKLGDLAGGTDTTAGIFYVGGVDPYYKFLTSAGTGVGIFSGSNQFAISQFGQAIIRGSLVTYEENPTIVAWNASGAYLTGGTNTPASGYIRASITADVYWDVNSSPIKNIGGIVMVDTLIVYGNHTLGVGTGSLDSLMLQALNLTNGTWATVKSWTTGISAAGFFAVNVITGGDYAMVDVRNYRIKASYQQTVPGTTCDLLGCKMVYHCE